MKLKLQHFLVPILLLAGYFLLSSFLPKYSGQYIFMMLLFLGDLYLWSSLKKKVFSNVNWLRVLIISLYWLPLAMVAFIVVGAIIVPIVQWNDSFRTLWFGFILIFYMAKLPPILFLLLADFFRLINKLVRLMNREHRQKVVQNEEGISRSKFLQYLGFISGGLVMGTMFTGMFKWVHQFMVSRLRIRINNLPASFKGLKIVQLSDMHLGSWTNQKPLVQAIEMVNDMKPDIIVFTGDLVNFSTREAFRFEDVLAKMKADKGIFAVLGNHDYGDYVNWPDEKSKQRNMDDLYALYNRLGWKLLNNESHLFEGDGGNLALIGVENWGANPRFPKYGDLNKAINGYENADAKVLLSHDPTHWDKVVLPGNHKIDLTLAGHTHGFQFGYESPKFKWSPAKWIYKHWAGLYADKASGSQLYVNRGLGSIGYPGRIGIMPEITLIELV